MGVPIVWGSLMVAYSVGVPIVWGSLMVAYSVGVPRYLWRVWGYCPSGGTGDLWYQHCEEGGRGRWRIQTEVTSQGQGGSAAREERLHSVLAGCQSHITSFSPTLHHSALHYIIQPYITLFKPILYVCSLCTHVPV